MKVFVLESANSLFYILFVQESESRLLCMHYFRLARDPTQGALPDPYLGQSIGPVPGYGVSHFVHFDVYILFIFSSNVVVNKKP